ncbi:C39 family peptidase [Hydrogenivirga sp.]
MRWLLVLLVPVMWGCSYTGQGGPTSLYLPLGTTGTSASLKVGVKPASEIKFRNIIRQKLDYSCGSAAVATIFNHYLLLPVSEDSVTREMFEKGNREKISKRRGFSLLDMKRYAERKGYRAYGIKTTLKGLASLKKPVIVTIVINDYKHFVVFRGVHRGRVFIADPAFGNTTMTTNEFEKVWYKGIALVIDSDVPYAKHELAISDRDMNMVNAGNLRGELVPPMLPTYTRSTDF